MSVNKKYFKAIEENMVGTGYLEGFLERATGMRYSVSNVANILQQYPEATDVAGYRFWQQEGVNVLRGAVPIRIYAPKERDPKKGTSSFCETEVFDVSQTDGSPFKKPPESLHPRMAATLALKMGMGVAISDNVNGWKEMRGKKLFLKEGLSPAVYSQLIIQQMCYYAVLKEKRCSPKMAKAISYAASYGAEASLGGRIPLLGNEVKEELLKGEGFFENLSTAVKIARRILTALKKL